MGRKHPWSSSKKSFQKWWIHCANKSIFLQTQGPPKNSESRCSWVQSPRPAVRAWEDPVWVHEFVILEPVSLMEPMICTEFAWNLSNAWTVWLRTWMVMAHKFSEHFVRHSNFTHIRSIDLFASTNLSQNWMMGQWKPGTPYISSLRPMVFLYIFPKTTAFCQRFPRRNTC